MKKKRREFDSIGYIDVPSDKYWGASTQWSDKYFDIGEILVKTILIKSIAIIKKSAAIVHKKNKQVSLLKLVLIYFGKTVSPLPRHCILYNNYRLDNGRIW